MERPAIIFGLPYDKWEEAITVNADYFTLIRFLGSSRFQRFEYPNPHDALDVLATMAPKEAERWMMYAVSGVHSIHIERAKRERLIALYDKWRSPAV